MNNIDFLRNILNEIDKLEQLLANPQVRKTITEEQLAAIVSKIRNKSNSIAQRAAIGERLTVRLDEKRTVSGILERVEVLEPKVTATKVVGQFRVFLSVKAASKDGWKDITREFVVSKLPAYR